MSNVNKEGVIYFTNDLLCGEMYFQQIESFIRNAWRLTYNCLDTDKNKLFPLLI